MRWGVALLALVAPLLLATGYTTTYETGYRTAYLTGYTEGAGDTYACPTNAVRCRHTPASGEPEDQIGCTIVDGFPFWDQISGGPPTCNDHVLGNMAESTWARQNGLTLGTTDPVEVQFDYTWLEPGAAGNGVLMFLYGGAGTTARLTLFRNGAAGTFLLRCGAAGGTTSGANYPSGSTTRGVVRFWPDSGMCELLTETNTSGQHGRGTLERVTHTDAATIGGDVVRLQAGNGGVTVSPYELRNFSICDGLCDTSSFETGDIASFGDSVMAGFAGNDGVCDFLNAEGGGLLNCPDESLANGGFSMFAGVRDGTVGVLAVAPTLAASYRWGTVYFGHNDMNSVPPGLTTWRDDYELALREGVDALIAEGIIPVVHRTHRMWLLEAPPYCTKDTSGSPNREGRATVLLPDRLARVVGDYDPPLLTVDNFTWLDQTPLSEACNGTTDWGTGLYTDHIHLNDAGNERQAQEILAAIRRYGRTYGKTLPAYTAPDFGQGCEYTLDFCTRFTFISELSSICRQEYEVNEAQQVSGATISWTGYPADDTSMCTLPGRISGSNALGIPQGDGARTFFFRNVPQASTAGSTVTARIEFRIDALTDTSAPLLLDTNVRGGADLFWLRAQAAVAGDLSSVSIGIQGRPSGALVNAATGLDVRDQWFIAQIDYATNGDVTLALDPAGGTPGAGTLGTALSASGQANADVAWYVFGNAGDVAGLTVSQFDVKVGP